jgi:cytochrome c biogenesis protein CcmG, thiol:disulfide interchange protein DsbE
MSTMTRRMLFLAPLGIAAMGGASFWTMLQRMQSGQFDPRGVPTMLIGKPAPPFALPGLGAQPGFSNTDFATQPAPVLLNFFASWCVPCALEAQQLAGLRARGATVWGITYKDKPEATAAFLRRGGNPFARIAVDTAGRTGIDFGISGVPETFLIDRIGTVRRRWVGPLTDAIVAEDVQPMLARYA